MTQEGFEVYLYAVYGQKNGTANSYIKAIHIIDELFADNDVFALKGQSLTSIDDFELLEHISDFIYAQQSLYKKNYPSFFDNIKSGQSSYPGKGFCSAAINKLLQYYTSEKEINADKLIANETSGKRISEKLIVFYDIEKEGTDVKVTAKARLGQDYFRKLILKNYGNKCCVTGLNIPQTLRASHIVAWADDKKNRLNPENGLCLSATYDAAFDKHLISFDDNYKMIVSKEIKEYYTNDVVKEYFGQFEGKKIILPNQFLPSKQFLEKHRNKLVV